MNFEFELLTTTADEMRRQRVLNLECHDTETARTLALAQSEYT